MKCCVIINAYVKTREYLYEAERLDEELTKLGVFVDVIRLDEYPSYIRDGEVCSDFSAYDFCVYLDKDKYILDMLEKEGIRVFNKSSAIATCDDKMTTYIALSGYGVPMPKTLPGILCYDKNEEIKEKSILKIEKELSYPLVVKESYGSLGKGVYLAESQEELLSMLEKVKTKPHLLQEFVGESRGKDLRVIVVGNEVVGAMERKSETDFRSNVGAGGRGTAVEIDEKTKILAEKVSKILGLDYCGIDFLYSSDGVKVCEVNSNAYFFTFEKVTGINVAKIYAKHILSNMTK